MRRRALTIKQILAWADAHHERTGKWPEVGSGRVLEPADEKWANIDQCLRKGLRGLNPGQSLARLLAKHRGKRNRKALPRFTIRTILAWADRHHERHGRWPRGASGPIVGAPGETWYAVEVALRNGQRGTPGGSSLAQLLSAKRGVPNPAARPRLTQRQILAWADAHSRRTGTWPLVNSRPVAESPADTWVAIDQALAHGRRGLRQGGSLAKLLARHRGVRRHVRRPRLNERQILAWADAYHQRHKRWPVISSGPIPEAPGDTWRRVDRALRFGTRGLAGETTLATLLAKRRSARNVRLLPPLTEAQILRWARAYRRRHGRWPNRDSGPVANSGGETWAGIRVALNHAGRGLKRRTTLKQLFEAHY